MRPLHHDESPPLRSDTKVRNDSVFQDLLEEGTKIQHPGSRPRTGIKIDDLLLAAPANILIETTESNRSSCKTATTATARGSRSGQSGASYRFRGTGRSRLIHQAIYPRPKLPAVPPSTETLAPGMHLSTDAKRWMTRNPSDQHFVSSFTVHDIDTLRPGTIGYAPGLLALLQAAAACAKQASLARKARRRSKRR